MSFDAPAIESLNIKDIAHSLSQLCRFNGHTHRFYSVAQHSILCAQQVPEYAKLHALMHDAHEAYVGDITTPVKRNLGPWYNEMTSSLDAIIFERFGIEPHHEVVNHVDLRMMITEAHQLLLADTSDWGFNALPFNFNIETVDPVICREMFVNLFHIYGGKP